MKTTLNEIAAKLREWDRILVVSHRSPDGDTLGCASALLRGLQHLGKTVSFACADEIGPRFAFLFEGMTFPAFEPEHVVSVDIAAPSLMGSLEEVWYPRLEMCIDHHGSNSMEAPFVYVDSTAAAACESIYQLLQLLDVPVTPVIADCLYTGITTDTGCFKYANVTPRTYRIAAELIELGAHGPDINRVLLDTKSRARVEMEKQIYESLHYYFDGKCAVVCITDAMKEKAHATEDDTDGLAGLSRQIEGVLIGITLTEKGENDYRVSLRTTPAVNASEIAGVFGGGGHAGAAGCRILAPYAEAEAQLTAAVKNYLEEHHL